MMELLNQYTVRRLTTKNKTGDAFGMTLPKDVAILFSEVTVNVFVSGNAVVLESGAKLSKREIDEYNRKKAGYF